MFYFFLIIFVLLIAVVLWALLALHPVVQHQKALSVSINRLDKLFDHRLNLAKAIPEIWREAREELDPSKKEELEELISLYQELSDLDAQNSCDIQEELHDTIQTVLELGDANPQVAAHEGYQRHKEALEESRKAINQEVRRFQKLASQYNRMLTAVPNNYTTVLFNYGEVEVLTLELQ